MAPSNERVRTRKQRVASRIDYNGVSQRIKKLLFDDNGMKKLALVFVAAVVVTLVSCAWDPPMKYSIGSMTDRDIVCNVTFSAIDKSKTKLERNAARMNTPRYYSHDVAKLFEYKAVLRAEMRGFLDVVDLSNFTSSSPQAKKIAKYLPGKPSEQEMRDALKTLQLAYEEDVDLADYSLLLDKVFQPFEKNGILRERHGSRDSYVDVVKVFDKADVKVEEITSVWPSGMKDEKTSGKAVATLSAIATTKDASFTDALDDKLGVRTVPTSNVAFAGGVIVKKTIYPLLSSNRALADLLFERIRQEPPETLIDEDSITRMAKEDAARRIGVVHQTFHSGESIVAANSVVSYDDYSFLKEERKAALAKRSTLSRVIRFGATLTLNLLLMVSAYFIIVSKRLAHNANNVRHSLKDNAVFLTFIVLFFAMGRFLPICFPTQGSSLSLVPVVIFVELITFSISWGVALTTGVTMSLMLTISQGGSPEAFVPLCGVTVLVAFLARTVRTRLQLVYLAVNTGICAFLLSLVMNFLSSDCIRIEGKELESFVNGLRVSLGNSLHEGGWAFAGGALSSCILPVVELFFHVVTPMQLLEYANPSHPLMIELNQKAPATYNHSIQTSTLAEAAAEAIGARSYLVKVGAYFHDVGKMMNPEYFTENQNGFNIHNELSPRMSALAIVAHVKDGVTAGRNHRLPREIVELIEQHHGTMLVSFFYQRALKAAQETDPDARLDEGPFRYPGPIPQTREAGVLMLADAVESASRSLTDWSPRRVENLVRKITEMRIEDGQFRESGLTFGEIQTIQQSLVTSILASRHSRIGYPDEKDKDKEKESRDDSKDSSSITKRPDDGSSQIVRLPVRDDDSQIVASRAVKSKGERPAEGSSSSSDTSRIVKIPD